MGKIIVGLGNFEKQYLKNRHNAGFMALDKLKKKFEFDEFKEEKKFEAEISQGEINGIRILLIKPLTFMNKSGNAVRKIADYFKLDKKDIIVIYDDIDLPLGTIRIRAQGSAGTHNGMKSMINELGTEEFTRIRIGIESRGELSPEKQETVSFVLSDFNPKEEPIFLKTISKIPEEIEKILEDTE
jgi:peptidyl-tRNA hydrolase, PTH1 family